MRVHPFLHLRNVSGPTLHEIPDVQVHRSIHLVLGPPNAHLAPRDEVLEREHEAVRDNQRNATREEAFVQMVRPRRSSLGNDAEVRLAHDLEVLFNEATDADVGQVSKLRQGPTDRHVFVVAVVHGQPAVEIEEQCALGARQVVLPDQPDAVPIQVTWNDDVLPRVEAARPASRREGLRGQENRVRDLVAPRREGVREVHDEALVREDEDVIHTMSPLEEGKLAEQLPKRRVRIGASSVLVLVVPNEHRVIIISFDAREAPLLKGRRHVVVASTVVRDEEKIGLVRVQSAARGGGEVAMQRHLDPPLPGRAEQRAQGEIAGVVNE
eukprot:CAMPEP_0183390514 /NCGR_PEP_ID=MMETSP0370-20130417/5754_1 /TAXON_ID=268820 /ORGANISM="Peridinium aciculiferum, Strain PAER-2" /LENGTH=324 /DNA_ID=CAMNT_0025570033 /DNA_START=199 /DNA_END=1170 /DNA_ORIENTATION=+